MKKNKIVAMGLVAFMAVGMLSGCKGTDTTQTQNSDTGETTGEGSGEVKELTFFNADGKEDTSGWTDPVALAISEATGIKLKTDYSLTGDATDIALMIAEGKYPDLMYAKGDIAQLVEAGAMIDMTELIDEYGPNIKAMYGDEYTKLKYSAEDPSIYQLSSYAVGGETYLTAGTAQLQWDVIKANDYKYPKTIAEYEEVIRNYLKENPTDESGNPNIGISISSADWHWLITLANPAGFIANGAPDNGQWLVDDANGYKATYKHSAQGQKEYFAWLNKLYQDGILDPDFATQTHEDYIAKIASGRVLGLLDADWDYGEGEKVLKADGKYGKTYAGLPVTLNESVKSHALMYQGLTTGWGIGITTDCEDPVAAIKFLDYMCSEEGQILCNWGIKDTNYFVDDDGKRYRTEEEVKAGKEDPDYGKKTGVGLHTYPFPYHGAGELDSTGNTFSSGVGPYASASKEATIKEYNEEEKAACEAWGVEMLKDIFPQVDEFEVPPYSALWAYPKPTEFNEIEAILNEIAWPGLIECVKADSGKFDATWDKLQKELDGAGRVEAEDMLSQIIQGRIELMEDNK